MEDWTIERLVENGRKGVVEKIVELDVIDEALDIINEVYGGDWEIPPNDLISVGRLMEIADGNYCDACYEHHNGCMWSNNLGDVCDYPVEDEVTKITQQKLVEKPEDFGMWKVLKDDIMIHFKVPEPDYF